MRIILWITRLTLSFLLKKMRTTSRWPRYWQMAPLKAKGVVSGIFSWKLWRRTRRVFLWQSVDYVPNSRYDSMYKHFQHEEAPDSSPQKRVYCGCFFRARGDAYICYLIMAFRNLISDFDLIIGECEVVRKYVTPMYLKQKGQWDRDSPSEHCDIFC